MTSQMTKQIWILRTVIAILAVGLVTALAWPRSSKTAAPPPATPTLSCSEAQEVWSIPILQALIDSGKITGSDLPPPGTPWFVGGKIDPVLALSPNSGLPKLTTWEGLGKPAELLQTYQGIGLRAEGKECGANSD